MFRGRGGGRWLGMNEERPRAGGARVAWVGRSLVVVRRSLDGHLTVTSRFVFGFESDGWGSSGECVVASADEGLEGDLGGFDALEFGGLVAMDSRSLTGSRRVNPVGLSGRKSGGLIPAASQASSESLMGSILRPLNGWSAAVRASSMPVVSVRRWNDSTTWMAA